MFAILSSLGVVEGLKFGWKWLADRREAARKAREDELAAAKDAGKQDREATTEDRKDAVAEWQAIAEERKQEKDDCHERLDAAEAEIAECKEDRAQLRGEVNALKGRMDRVEKHGNGEVP